MYKLFACLLIALCFADCAPGCPVDYPGDSFCDAACNNEQCNYDDGDCEDVEPSEDECPACDDVSMGAFVCLFASCGDYMMDEDALNQCMIDKCGNVMVDLTNCQYNNGCAELDTCDACMSQEKDRTNCMIEILLASICEEEDMQCMINHCGSKFSAVVSCDYEKCDSDVAYDAYVITYICGDGSSCDGECTQFVGDRYSFDGCQEDVDDYDDSSVMSVSLTCNHVGNSTGSVEALVCSSSGCVGGDSCSSAVVDGTNGYCGNLENDDTDQMVYLYKYFGSCGAETYDQPTTQPSYSPSIAPDDDGTSSLLVTFVFAILFILY